jgi:hypothetical protein
MTQQFSMAAVSEGTGRFGGLGRRQGQYCPRARPAMVRARPHFHRLIANLIPESESLP